MQKKDVSEESCSGLRLHRLRLATRYKKSKTYYKAIEISWQIKGWTWDVCSFYIISLRIKNLTWIIKALHFFQTFCFISQSSSILDLCLLFTGRADGSRAYWRTSIPSGRRFASRKTSSTTMAYFTTMAKRYPSYLLSYVITRFCELQHLHYLLLWVRSKSVSQYMSLIIIDY